MNTIIEQHYKKNFDRLTKEYARAAGSPENGEDVIQEAYSRALKYFPSFNPEMGEFDNWFSRIRSRCLKDFKSDEKAMGTRVPEEEAENEMVSSEDTLFNNLRLDDVKAVIAGKVDYTREVLHMYFIQQYTVSDICRVMDSNPTTVIKMLQRFKHEMRGTEI